MAIKQFNWNEFIALENPVHQKTYADETLPQIGTGSSRAVYVIDPNFVLKIATNIAGAKQNRKEVQISENPKFTSIIAKVVAYGPRYLWTKAERVFPLEDKTGEKKFTEYYGVNADTAVKHPEIVDQLISKTKEYSPSTERNVRIKKLELLKLIQEMKRDYKIALVDFEDYHQWGQTKDGRIVILDYGYDYDLYKEHYTKSKKKELKEFDEYIKALLKSTESFYKFSNTKESTKPGV